MPRAVQTEAHRKDMVRTVQKLVLDNLRAALQQQKSEFKQRLSRIGMNHRRPLEPDSKERATQIENQEVVDALGNEAREELGLISAALERISSGKFGVCTECGERVSEPRLVAFPQAEKCIDCASLDEEMARRSAYSSRKAG